MRQQDRVVVHTNVNTGDYFFSTDHCQKTHAPQTYPTESGWVPTTYYLPQGCVPRPSLPEGVIRTQADVVTIFHHGDREIPNPDPRYQPRSHSSDSGW